jgi:L-rhamnose mutarotase
MQRICFVLQVKPERLAEYKERHRQVWPEMKTALRETGWDNYSLFLRDDGLLVGYLETDNFERARAEIAKREVNERWQREMRDFFVQPDGTPLADLGDQRNPNPRVSPLVWFCGSALERFFAFCKGLRLWARVPKRVPM